MGFTPIVSSQTITSEAIYQTQRILDGGVAYYTSIYLGGYQNVYCGVVNYTSIYSGGSQDVFGLSLARSTIIFSGGLQIVSGGVVSSTVISSGGIQNIYGGSVSSTAINGGIQNIYSGCKADNTTIVYSGLQIVSSGGTAINTAVNNIGSQLISSGGIASSTIINSGSQFISSGGVAINTTISGGAQLVYGVASNTTINSGGWQNIYSGVANSTIINRGGIQYVRADGFANITTISGGSQTILSAGVASNTTMNGGGSQLILSGGVANNTTMSGGSQIISSGGVASNTTFFSGGSQFIYVGGVTNNTTISAGSQTIYSGGVANSTTMTGGVQNIIGGVANNTTVSGGSQFIFGMGVASNTTMSAGSQFIYVGGVASNTTMSGCRQTISSGGVANSTTMTGGVQNIIGGVANNTTVSGGSQIISSGGVASNTTFFSGGSQTISSGGVASDTAMNGGVQNISYSGLASNITLNGGSQLISSAGVAKNTSINGGSQVIYGGGTVINTIINSGGSQTISSGGIASKTIVNSGGSMYVLSGGIISFGLTVAGGHVTLDSAATSFSSATISYVLATANTKDALITFNTSYVDAIYSLNLDNTITGSYILADGVDLSNMTSKWFSVTDNGQGAYIQVGRSYTFTNGDKLSISLTSAATDQLMAVFTAGLPVTFTPIVSSQTVTGETVSSGTQSIINSGIANSTIINYSGYQNISSGGVANYTAINSGGSQNVSSGGVASFTTISLSGYQQVYSGGVASNTIVNSGGRMVVNSGGTASNALTVAGGHVMLANAASFNSLTTVSYILNMATTGDALITVNGGTLGIGATAYSLNLDNTASGAYILADGVDLSGINGKIFSVTDNGQSVNVQVGSSYTFNNGDKLALNFTDSTRDQLTAVLTNVPTDTIPPSSPVGLIRTITENSAALTWNASTDNVGGSGVKQYEIMVDNNADFSSAEYSASAVASAATVNSLADGIYYWKVRSQDNAGNYSDWANGGSFIVDINAPSVPASLTPVVTGNNVALDWADSTDAPSGVEQYQVQLDKHADFSSPEYSATPTNSTANFNGLADGTYYWRVNTQDNAGNTSAWSSGSSFVSDVGGTISGALLLAIPSTTGWVGIGDTADYYKITMTNAGMLTLGLTGLTGNADMSLLDAKNTVLKSSTKTGTADEAIVGVPLQAGDYYVKVAPGFGVKDANYTLAHTEKYCPVDTAANTWQTAKNIDDGVDTWVGFGDSADYYKLTMANAGTLTLGLTGLTGNADLALLNSAGTSLKTSANTGTTPETLTNVLLLAGTYYVKVATGFGVNDASYTLTHAEKYTPADKAANDYKTALDISTLDNWVGFGDAADFYKLTMTNAGTLSLGLTGLTSNADLSLLNSAGTVLKTSAKTGTADESISNVLLLAGTYYVKVAGGTSVNDANYTLTHTEKYTPVDTGANTWQTAKDIGLGVDTWVGFGDTADFYKFTMTNAGMLTLGMTGLTGNADMSLLDAKNTVLKSSTKTGTADEAIVGVPLQAGDYYVKVAAGFGVNDASYNLSNTVKYFPVDKAANTWQTAQDISILDNWVGFGDSADYYKLTMTNAGTLTLGLTGLTGNADLALLNSAGTSLKTSANAGTANEAINNVALLAGTYYVKVATGFGVNDASYNLSNTVSYFPGDTSDKAGNTPAAAKLVDSPAQTGWVGFGDSDDYYKFDLATAAQGTLRLYDMTGGNADLTLYDAKGVQLQKSAKTGALEDTITRNLAAGTYYARVNAVSGNIDYKLDFSKKDGYGMLAS